MSYYAQPQRPRAWRVRDENLPPVDVGPMKTIHQRNKSTPVLSTLLQPAGGKGAGLRRAAFADVSNVAGARGAPYPAKDDSSLVKKVNLERPALIAPIDASKENPSKLDALKSAALLRPAQRPLSTAAAKIALANSTAPAISNVIQPPTTTSIKPIPTEKVKEDARPVKTLAKKQTTIFKDTAASALNEQASKLEPQQPLRSIDLAPLPTFQALPPIADSVSLPKAIDELLPLPLPDANEQLAAQSTNLDMPAAVSTANLSIDDILQVPRLNSDLLPSEFPGKSRSASELELPASLQALLELAHPTAEVEKASEVHLQEDFLPQTRAEPEECWDDDEEEYFDADGYTTARSIRSRGGDTTGGVTIVMEPRVTARVERELAVAKHFVEATRTPDDIEDEAWDTSMVAEYGDEIFDYMRDLERRMKPNPHYMDNQTEIQWSMRAVLMDWLVQVHHRFTLLPETLFLSVNYVDRFLSCKVVSLNKLQLVGATAIFVAAKYEEINCPSVQEIIYMVDSHYTMDEILKAERFMLTMLNFELGWPGPMSFLRRVSKADDYDLETRTLAKYFLEVTLMDERFVGCAPSFTAAGAHCLARLMLRKGDWVSLKFELTCVCMLTNAQSLLHVHYSQYLYSQLRPLVQTILECCEDPRKHHAAVFDKYSDKRYKRASIYVETEIQKGFQLPPASRESNGHSQTFRKK